MPVAKKVSQKEPGIFKLETGKWLVEFRPGGRGSPKFKRVIETLAEARQAKNYAMTQSHTGQNYSLNSDQRKLSDLCQAWYDLHGQALASGLKRLASLKKIATTLGDPKASKCKAEDFLKYRKTRLDAGITPNHLNHELAYLKAVFNELERANQWTIAKPFDKLKRLKFSKRSLTYLSKAEIKQLLASARQSRNTDLETVIRICLSTGARFGEASDLHAEHVTPQLVNYIDTKNDLHRAIPINPDLYQRITGGRPQRGPLFGPCWQAFNNALELAGITLPKGQKTHVLRHTFASHYIMDGGQLLVLNKALGHENIQMTMIYAHLAPEHLEDILTRNPLANKSEQKTVPPRNQ